MTNQKRAENLIISIADGSLIPAERIPEVREMLNEAEARGRKAGLEEAVRAALTVYDHTTDWHCASAGREMIRRIQGLQSVSATSGDSNGQK